jgi:hypothetical protein
VLIVVGIPLIVTEKFELRVVVDGIKYIPPAL